MMLILWLYNLWCWYYYYYYYYYYCCRIELREVRLGHRRILHDEAAGVTAMCALRADLRCRWDGPEVPLVSLLAVCVRSLSYQVMVIVMMVMMIVMMVMMIIIMMMMMMNVVISSRYKENLKKFYILHASLSFRLYFWLLLPMETQRWIMMIMMMMVVD